MVSWRIERDGIGRLLDGIELRPQGTKEEEKPVAGDPNRNGPSFQLGRVTGEVTTLSLDKPFLIHSCKYYKCIKHNKIK